MRWLADECVDAGVVNALRNTGHDVLYIAEASAGLADPQVIALAEAEGRVFLTEDKDFGELVFRFRLVVPGLVLLRIDPTRSHLKSPRLAAVISQIGDGLVGSYAVVTETRTRLRHLDNRHDPSPRSR
jgi:predicted nuclease of predicted toxin-antitoxin system